MSLQLSYISVLQSSRGNRLSDLCFLDNSLKIVNNAWQSQQYLLCVYSSSNVNK
jgi:protein involved in temperature-dependent protein secretion